MQIRLLKTREEYLEYQKKFNEILENSIPFFYLYNSETWCLFDDNKIIGGFSIVSDYINLRCVSQIPDSNIRLDLQHSLLKYNDISELTGYFLTGKKYRFIFKTFFFLRCLFHNKKKFIYAYDKENHKLNKYYGFGKPKLIYSGILKYEEKQNSWKEENVEILTKYGILLILVKSTFFKIFKKRL